MDEYEMILDEARTEGVKVIEKYDMGHGRLKGLYCDHVIALSDRLETYKERRCVLGEELGHYHMTCGDITDQSTTANRKQEYRARLWGYNRILGLSSIVTAYQAHCENEYEAAEYLGVSEWYFKNLIQCFRSKYGTQPVPVGTCFIIFEPQLLVLERDKYLSEMTIHAMNDKNKTMAATINGHFESLYNTKCNT